ncbi:MAG: hypothetical protein Q9222_005671 [Ikaeria aurantiellina]
MTEKKQRFKLPQPVSTSLAFLKTQLPPLNFITLHYAYFIGVCILASLIFWGSASPARSISYTDSLFLVVSAMTLAGLNTVNLSELNTFQQFILFVLIILGSAILVSIAVVFVRLKAFERRFKTVVEEEKRKQKERGSLRRRMTFRSSTTAKRPTDSDSNGGLRERHTAATTMSENGVAEKDMELGGSVSPIEEEKEEKVKESPPQRRPLTINTNTETQPTQSGQKEDHNELPSGFRRTRGPTITFAQSPVIAGPQKIAPLARILSMQGVGARHDLPNHPIRIARTENLLSPVVEHQQPWKMSDLVHHFSIPGITGRNSQFSSLSFADRERIGGVEYRALEILAIIVPLYFIFWQLLSAISVGAWISNNRRDLTQGNGLDPWYAVIIYVPGMDLLIRRAGG